MLAIDQFGNTYFIEGKHPRKELLNKFGKKSAKKIYRDKKDRSIVSVGYLISGLWLTLYNEYEILIREGEK